MRMRVARICAGLAVLVVALVGFRVDAAVGTLCAFCPIGFAQVAAAARAVPWELVPGVVALMLAVFALGRFFCSWLCPTALLKSVFGGHAPRGVRGCSGKVAGAGRLDVGKAGFATQAMVFGVLLVVSFAVRFPVFCLICPIGLVFGTLWALNRVFVLLQPGWELVVFPLMLVAELFLFKRWCSVICPLGFLFGLVGKLRARLGVGLRPKADCATCLSGEGCAACSTACAEDIAVAHAPFAAKGQVAARLAAEGKAEAAVLEHCTLCLGCKEHCPTKSIGFGKLR